MAAGKTVNVKLRYRRRSASPGTGQTMDPTKQEADIKHADLSPHLEDTSDTYLEPPPMMSGPIEPLNINTSFENNHLPPSTSLSAHPMASHTTADVLSQRRQRKGQSRLKRSSSTPNIRGNQNGDASMMLSEKRRNKLGYHRTSIACSTSFLTIRVY